MKSSYFDVKRVRVIFTSKSLTNYGRRSDFHFPLDYFNILLSLLILQALTKSWYLLIKESLFSLNIYTLLLLILLLVPNYLCTILYAPDENGLLLNQITLQMNTCDLSPESPVFICKVIWSERSPFFSGSVQNRAYLI